MRIAVIADVHGNLPALDAVLADVADQRVDGLVVNGDLANRGPDTVAVFARLETALACATLGNHDDLMLMWAGRRGPRSEPWFDDPFWGTVGWSAGELQRAGRLDVIESLPMTLAIDLPGAPKLLFSHGSPRHYREGYGTDLTPELISEITEAHPADVLIGSHTHRPYLTSWGRYTVINTGAVGAPFNGDRRAHYLILELTAGGWQPEFRRVPYDVDAALERFESSGMLEAGGLSAKIFREEIVHARSFLVPFLMWCETDGRHKSGDAWNEFKRRFEARFRPPEVSPFVSSSPTP
ncbi:MAG TPA: metallophosphoesterase family protein [Trueperaceae bacterium]|nr:metallophosphoesterase family protein [Trueperaceae bacterium]